MAAMAALRPAGVARSAITLASRRSTPITCAPAASRRRQTAAPIPEAEPVTATVIARVLYVPGGGHATATTLPVPHAVPPPLLAARDRSRPGPQPDRVRCALHDVHRAGRHLGRARLLRRALRTLPRRACPRRRGSGDRGAGAGPSQHRLPDAEQRDRLG